jgi:hypothetical protein
MDEDIPPEHRYIFVDKYTYYVGPMTKKIGCLLLFLCCPIVPCVFLFPCDVKKEVSLRNQASIDAEAEANDEFIIMQI